MNKLYDIAISYLNTPHINGGNIKGAGLDCCTLPANIYKEWLDINIPIKFGYTADWFCKRNCEEILLPYLEEHCFLVKDLQEGDVLSYRWGRANYAHLAVYIGDKKVIHCTADDGVVIEDIDSPSFNDAKGNSRISGIWRLKK